MIFSQKYAHMTILQGVRQEYWDKPRILQLFDKDIPIMILKDPYDTY